MRKRREKVEGGEPLLGCAGDYGCDSGLSGGCGPHLDNRLWHFTRNNGDHSVRVAGWTYVGFLPLAGPIVDRLGAWMVLGVGSGIWGLATLALPLAGGSVVALFLIRALYGFGHCVRFPSQAWSIVRWFEPNERATAVGFCFSGGQVGLALGTMSSALMLVQLGWQSIFYIIGFVSLSFTVLWFLVYPEKKSGCQRAMTEVESGKDEVRVPWSSLWRHRSV